MKKRYKGEMFAFALLTVTGLFAGTITSQGVVYVSETPYVRDSNGDDSSYGGPSYDGPRSTDSEIGPGAAPSAAEEQEVTAGPAVHQVTLAEQYHEEYKIYEESINGLFFFYTNVSNGGITDQMVTLDMPQNVFCSVEKDGAEYDYVPGQTFSEYGTYVVRVTAVEDTSVPFSEQKEYRALFRFRIQEKPPEETKEGEEGNGLPEGLINDGFGVMSGFSESGIWSNGGNSGTGVGEPGLGESMSESLVSELESPDASETSAGESADGGIADGEMTGEEESVGEENQEGVSESAGADSGEMKADAAETEGMPGAYRERTQTYDSSRGRYEVVFDNGRTLSSNVPEGYMGPAAVELLVSEGEGSIFCNDEPLEYAESMSLKEPGYYCLDIDGQKWSFAIASAVGSTDYYMAPAGMEFTGVYFDGEPEKLPAGRYLPMREDGQYQISMTGEAGEVLEVVLRKDTEPPQVAVHVKGGTAQIQYVSDDIEKVILEKNGEIQEGFAGYTIDSPGSYRLTAVDEAGNTSSTEFSLKYQVNMYGIVAVVLVILLIAGGAAFVIHVKRTVKVR